MVIGRSESVIIRLRCKRVIGPYSRCLNLMRLAAWCCIVVRTVSSVVVCRVDRSVSRYWPASHQCLPKESLKSIYSLVARVVERRGSDGGPRVGGSDEVAKGVSVHINQSFLDILSE